MKNIEIVQKKDVKDVGQKKDVESSVPKKDVESSVPKKDVESSVPKKDVESSVPKKDKKPIKNNNKDQTSVIKGFIGKEIDVILRNGNHIKGKLESVSQYEVVITMEYNPVIVMKHAMDYIMLTGGK